MPSVMWIGFAALALPVACTPAQRTNTSGSRPERFVRKAAAADRFVGEWGPGPDYLANDWKVRFTLDHRIRVSGPGMDARGTFSVQGRGAIASYGMRNGEVPEEPSISNALFTLSPDGTELTFSTGLPNDPPVRLVRRGA